MLCVLDGLLLLVRVLVDAVVPLVGAVLLVLDFCVVAGAVGGDCTRTTVLSTAVCRGMINSSSEISAKKLRFCFWVLLPLSLLAAWLGGSGCRPALPVGCTSKWNGCEKFAKPP